MPLGYPLPDDEPAIKVTPGLKPYESFNDVPHAFRPLGSADTAREAAEWADHMRELREDEAMRSRLSAEIQHEAFIRELRASGQVISSHEEERLRILALGRL